ncbi:TetR/AcrR family transcriptional regulator [Chitinophaga filiformis]|uniref:TetR/AcrR family transcriptional regulator n=1 Tax=Chitinophaga filiformis TaxID=104663 RepID=A0ABY4IAE5_CHIFI|nr:TetR/AcrR family transcriptional regulator [Chitinophaga filiformis]UPK72510.1 TetR/AcrR family transcriptional regulator [Chitinophaga filiformis]
MKKSERTRQFIIEQAADLFNEKGIAGTSIDDILQAAKVAKGCLYGHFQSKDELAYASAEYLLDKLTTHRNRIMQEQPTAMGKLTAFAELNANPLNGSFIHGGCPIMNFAVEADDTNPAIREKVRSVISQTIKMLTGIIKEGVKAGELSPSINADEIAMKMFATVEGAIMMSRVTGSSLPMKTAVKSMKKELSSYSLV